MAYDTNFSVGNIAWYNRACFAQLPRSDKIGSVIYYPVHCEYSRGHGHGGGQVLLTDNLYLEHFKSLDISKTKISYATPLTKEECEKFFDILHTYYPHFTYEFFLDERGMLIWKCVVENPYKNLTSVFFCLTALRYVDEYQNFVKAFVAKEDHSYKSFLATHTECGTASGHAVVGYGGINAVNVKGGILERHIKAYFTKCNSFMLNKIYGA